MAVTIEQSADAPNYFDKSIKVTVTTAESSIAAAEFNQLLYQIEGQDIAPLAYGTGDAKPMVFSFWVKSSVTGSFPFSVQNQNGSRVFPSRYTVNNANTWEYKTISISGDTGGTWNTSGNALGLRFTFLWLSGSTYTGGIADGGWKATSSYVNLTSTYTAPINTANATLQITGVQMEVGKVATPFEHRSYGEELVLCQRYYQQFAYTETYQTVGDGQAGTTSSGYVLFRFLNEMRVPPTISHNGVGKFRVNSFAPGQDQICTSIVYAYVTRHGARIQFGKATADLGMNQNIYINTEAGNDAYLYISAEL